MFESNSLILNNKGSIPAIMITAPLPEKSWTIDPKENGGINKDNDAVIKEALEEKGLRNLNKETTTVLGLVGKEFLREWEELCKPRSGKNDSYRGEYEKKNEQE